MLIELVEQRVHLQRHKTISVRVCEHGMTTRATNPTDRLPEADPLMDDVTDLPCPQELFERGPGVGGVTLLHQEAGEVAAAYDRGASGKPAGSRQTARDTRGAQSCRDLLRTNTARFANRCQAVGQRGIARIYAESEYMHCQAGPGDGNLDSRHEADTGLSSRSCRLRQPADFVMVGKRENAYPVLSRTPDQRRWSQHSIGIGGVAV